MAAKKKGKRTKKGTPTVVPGSGQKDEVEPEQKSNVVRNLTAEEGWRFLFIRKGDEMLNEQMAEVNTVVHVVKSLKDAATLLTDKAATLEQIGQEKLKRIQAQRELWNATHSAFREKLNLPDNSRVTHNSKTNVFDVVMLPPPQPGQ